MVLPSSLCCFFVLLKISRLNIVILTPFQEIWRGDRELFIFESKHDFIGCTYRKPAGCDSYADVAPSWPSGFVYNSNYSFMPDLIPMYDHMLCRAYVVATPTAVPQRTPFTPCPTAAYTKKRPIAIKRVVGVAKFLPHILSSNWK